MTPSDLRADWNSRRSKLNHGWLGKTYPAKLGALRRALGGEISDSAFVARFLRDDFAQWERYRPELARLIDEVPRLLSPLARVDDPPLSALAQEDRQWVGALTAAVWSQQHDVEGLVNEAKRLLAKADEIYDCLVLSIKDASSADLEHLRSLADQFDAFHRVCCDLSAVISRFPHEVA